jgi:hypothetical protein
MSFTSDQQIAFICGCAYSWNEDIKDSWDRANNLDNFIEYINDKIEYWSRGERLNITQYELEHIFNYFCCRLEQKERNGIYGILIDDELDNTIDWFIYINEDGKIYKKRINRPIVIGNDDDLFESLLADAQAAENEKAIMELAEESDDEEN